MTTTAEVTSVLDLIRKAFEETTPSSILLVLLFRMIDMVEVPNSAVEEVVDFVKTLEEVAVGELDIVVADAEAMDFEAEDAVGIMTIAGVVVATVVVEEVLTAVLDIEEGVDATKCSKISLGSYTSH